MISASARSEIILDRFNKFICSCGGGGAGGYTIKGLLKMFETIWL